MVPVFFLLLHHFISKYFRKDVLFIKKFTNVLFLWSNLYTKSDQSILAYSTTYKVNEKYPHHSEVKALKLQIKDYYDQ